MLLNKASRKKNHDVSNIICTLDLNYIDRQQKRAIRRLEQDIPKWQTLVEGSTAQGQMTELKINQVKFFFFSRI